SPGRWPPMRLTLSRSYRHPSFARNALSRRARGSAWTFLARAGLVARGVIYLLIGWIALLVAFGASSRQPNQAGALELLASKPYGQISLWLLGCGFAGYALWRLGEAAFGVTVDGTGAAARLKSLARAAVYAFLAYLTFQVLSG